MIDCLSYRELSEKIVTAEPNEKKASRIFTNLISKETDIEEKIINSFSEVMVENCKLGR